jgi:hypothetical protein
VEGFVPGHGATEELREDPLRIPAIVNTQIAPS